MSASHLFAVYDVYALILQYDFGSSPSGVSRIGVGLFECYTGRIVHTNFAVKRHESSAVPTLQATWYLRCKQHYLVVGTHLSQNDSCTSMLGSVFACCVCVRVGNKSTTRVITCWPLGEVLTQ